MALEKVDRQTFLRWIKSIDVYGGVSGIAEPPVGLWYTKDEILCAQRICHEAMEGHPLYKGEEDEYFINKDAFPNDPEWEEYKRLREKFGGK